MGRPRYALILATMLAAIGLSCAAPAGPSGRAMQATVPPAAPPATTSANAPPPAALASAAPTAPAALQRVTIGVNNTASDAPLFLADDRGYFRDVGLEIGLEELQGGAA